MGVPVVGEVDVGDVEVTLVVEGDLEGGLGQVGGGGGVGALVGQGVEAGRGFRGVGIQGGTAEQGRTLGMRWLRGRNMHVIIHGLVDHLVHEIDDDSLGWGGFLRWIILCVFASIVETVDTEILETLLLAMGE